jgi:16S rRNA (cytosine967-C5)-methyltransferase
LVGIALRAGEQRSRARDPVLALLAEVLPNGPAPLSAAEQSALAGLADQTWTHPEMPQATVLECPPWAEVRLRAAYGEDFGPQMMAQLAPAPVDVRVNTLKTDVATVVQALARNGINSTLGRHCPSALRLAGRPALHQTETYRNGFVEIQDEGSQILAALCQPKPGEQVVDFCAGAGGKSLALAAAMAGRGRVVACDVNARRLERAAERLRRAGAHNVERRVFTSERDPWVKRHKRVFDLVLTDVPCTGSGTWRRNPDSRWDRDLSTLEALTNLQRRILTSANRLVKPGGRLVYATCGLFRQENEDQVEQFLAEEADFQLVSPKQIWSSVLTGPCPTDGGYLRLTPKDHGTDGFFVAILQRSGDV